MSIVKHTREKKHLLAIKKDLYLILTFKYALYKNFENKKNSKFMVWFEIMYFSFFKKIINLQGKMKVSVKLFDKKIHD